MCSKSWHNADITEHGGLLEIFSEWPGEVKYLTLAKMVVNRVKAPQVALAKFYKVEFLFDEISNHN